MKKRPRTKEFNYWLTGAFLVSLLTVGLPYWSTPYYRLSLPDTLLEFAVVPLAVIALLVPFLCRATTARIALAIGVAAPVAVAVRIVVDVTQNPALHSLWPIEIVIAAIIGIVAAWPAAAIGGVLRYARARSKGHV